MAVAPVRALTRLSIGWSGNPHSEDVDALVLTINRYSVDLRMWAEGPNKGGIEWAMVGYVAAAAGSTDERPMLAWDNILDSRPAPPVSLPDEATFQLQPDGNVLETGTMWNPRTESAEPYEELWSRNRDSQRQGTPYYVLERTDGAWGVEGNTTARAFIGRLGGDILGIAVTGEGESVVYRDVAEGEGWTRKYEVGSAVAGLLPGMPVDVPKVWSVGAVVELGGGEWVVRELGTV